MYTSYSLDILVEKALNDVKNKIVIFQHDFRLKRFVHDIEDMFGVQIKVKSVFEIVEIDTLPLDDFPNKQKDVERILKRYGFRYKIV